MTFRDASTLAAMQSWQRFSALTTGVLALHGAALWAVQHYKVRMDFLDKTPALLTRMLEPPQVQELRPAPPPPPPTPAALPPPAQPLPKPVAKTAPLAPPMPSPAPQPAAIAAPAIAPSTSPALPTHNPAPASPAAAANVAPSIAAQTVLAAPASPSASKPPAPEPALELPVKNADHAETLYRHPFPVVSHRLREYGQVILAVHVGTDGKPLAVNVFKSSGFARIDEVGRQTVLRWRFKPGTRGGVPEPMWFNLPVTFEPEAER
jgi:periplasmic protein TonB